MASDLKPGYNQVSKEPAKAYNLNEWPQTSAQNALLSRQYGAHDFGNSSWASASLDPVFADLGPFPGLEEQEVDFLAMGNSLLSGNVTVPNDSDIPQSFPRPMKPPLKNASSPYSEASITSTPSPLRCPWDGCKRAGPFSKKGTLDRHIKTQHVAPRAFKCPQLGCDWSFNRKDNLNQHRRSVHQHVIPSQKGASP